MSVQDIHAENETLKVSILLPGHDPRTATPIFHSSRLKLMERDGPTCVVCGVKHTAQAPLEAHHNVAERCLTMEMDWALLHRLAILGKLPVPLSQHKALQEFDWEGFFAGSEEVDLPYTLDDGTTEMRKALKVKDPFAFVDNMLVNGEMLCKAHHIGADEGKHAMPHPLWLGQALARAGTKFSDVEIIHPRQDIQP